MTGLKRHIALKSLPLRVHHTVVGAIGGRTPERESDMKQLSKRGEQKRRVTLVMRARTLYDMGLTPSEVDFIHSCNGKLYYTELDQHQYSALNIIYHRAAEHIRNREDENNG